MGDVMRADLDAIRALADRQLTSAAAIRDLDLHAAFSSAAASVAGSDIAAVCSRADATVRAALAQVAARVDALAAANRHAAATLHLADDTYASAIRETLTRNPR